MSEVLLLLFPSFSEFEITVAAAILRHRYRLVTIALAPGPVVSEAGLQFLPDRTVAQVDPAGVSALIVPGGSDLSPVMDSPSVHTLVRALDRNRKLLAAICAGGIVLAKAGVLAGRPYTVSLYRRFRDQLGCFDEGGFQPAPLVESDHVLTAQGYAFVEFGLRLGARLDAIGDPAGVAAYYRGQGDLYWES